jgi:hypothetical protein
MAPRCVVCESETEVYKELSREQIRKCSPNVPEELLENYKILKCTASDCGLEQCDPMPSVEALSAYYSKYFDPRARSDVVFENARKNKNHLEQEHGLTKQQRLLDFGCGEGIFVDIGESENWLNYDGHKEKEGYAKMPEGNFDWIVSWGVLEHVVNPVEVFSDLVSKLNDGGKVALTTVGRTKNGMPYQFKPVEHVTYWGESSIRRFFERI